MNLAGLSGLRSGSALIGATILAAVLLLTVAHASPVNISGPGTSIADTYFGMHVHRVARGNPPTPWPVARIGAFRLWDTGVMWTHLEPQKGQWRFEELDRIVEIAQAQGVDLMLTLGVPPPWAASRPQDPFIYGPGGNSPPRDMADWENYVRAVATRYKGKIRYFELWNEPTYDEIDRSKGYFSGSVKTMVELARIAHQVIKQVDPANKLVSPPCTDDTGIGGRLDLFLSSGGKAYVEVIAHHFYVAYPERMLHYVSTIRAVMQKHGIAHLPLWNTESGFNIPVTGERLVADAIVENDEELAGMIARAHVLGAVSGLQRFYWYSWEITMLDRADKNESVNPIVLAYTQTLRWLRGIRVLGCHSPDRKLWTCALALDGRRAYMVWHERTPLEWQAPASWAARQYETLDARIQPLSAGQRLTLGPSPILIKTDTLLWSVYHKSGVPLPLPQP